MHARPLLVLAILLAQLPAWLGAGQLFVVCVGRGGHVDVEPVGSECCASTSELGWERLGLGAGRQAVGLFEAGDEWGSASTPRCGDCRDLGLAPDPATRRRMAEDTSFDLPVLLATVRPPQPVRVDLPDVCPSGAETFPSPNNCSLASLRSVVLLS